MRRVALLASASLALVVTIEPALPQAAGKNTQVASRATVARRDRGQITGRVINAATGQGQAGAAVTLTVADQSGARSTRRALTGRDGSYSFGGLKTGDDFIYALDATYRGGLFAGRPISLPGDTATPPVIDSTLRVWPTTSNPESVLVRRDALFLTPFEGTVSVIESVDIVNPTDRAYIGRGARMSSPENSETPTSFAFPLPPSAARETVRIVEGTTLDTTRLVPTDSGFGVTVAIPPGEHTIAFAYSATGSGGAFDLSRPALYPTLHMSIYATDPLAISTDRLSEEDPEEIGRETYRVWSSSRTLEAGDLVQAQVIAEGGAAPGLLWGAGVGLALLGLLGGVGLYRARRRQPGRRRPAAPAPATRDQLLHAIAKLDLERDAGNIDDREWRARRDALKSRIAESRTPERAS